jgi:4-oxalocrotonate tautomerase
MPEITVHAAEPTDGPRSIEQKRGLVKDLTDAIVRHFNVRPEAVVVNIIDDKRENKAKGGVLFSDRAPG